VLLKLVRGAAGDTTLKPQVIRDSLGRVFHGFVTSPPTAPRESAGKRRDAALKSWQTRKTTKMAEYAENIHTGGKPQEVLELYQRLDQFCLGLKQGDVQKRVWAKCIAYCYGKSTFCSVHLLRAGLRVWLKLKFNRIANPPSYVRDVSSVGHWGAGDVEVAITNVNQFAEAERLIRQSFDAAYNAVR
jgi:predicted transport protein